VRSHCEWAPPPTVGEGDPLDPDELRSDPYTAAVRRCLGRITEDSAGHWLWPGTTGANGDGLVKVKVDGRYRTVKAHRLIWSVLVGPLSDDYPLRSVCGRPECVRPDPDHRQPVTWSELGTLGANPWSQNARKTVCDGGHPLEGPESDVYVYPTGARECRHCRRQYWHDHYGSAAR
jgi:hypothetical protein